MRAATADAKRKEILGLIYALIGIFFFSLSLPLTKMAIDGFNPIFTAFVRPVIAATLAVPLLIAFKAPKFPQAHLRAFLFTISGGVFIWPIFIASALNRTTSAHVAIIVSIMPLSTAIFAVLRTKQTVSWQFWAASVLGTALLVLFAISRGGAADADPIADLFTLIAVIASSMCYVEGAQLTQVMPGWQVISWVVILALPICIPASFIAWVLTHHNHVITTRSVVGLLGIGYSSMYIGFIAWYRGLKDAGTAHGSQVQQVQAILTLGWSALLLHEKVTTPMVLIACGVIGAVLWALISRQRIPVIS
ncbi:MAG: DMT family transporter [Actinobacteria bacterium]|nr:DMT family transporter [Actinomycetota bacterium]